MSLPPIRPMFDVALLKHLVPLRELQPEDRQMLANKSHILELQRGEELIAADQHHWLLYLLDGKLDLRAAR